MKKVTLLILTLFACNIAQADNKYAAGMQSSFPAWGISGKMKIDDKITAQAILGPMGSLGTYAARGLYTFKSEKEYDMYGFGMLGLFTYEGKTLNLITLQNEVTTEVGTGFGAGVGIEANWQHLAPEMPPVYFSGEIGLGFINFDTLYSFNSIMIGAGVHYKFKK